VPEATAKLEGVAEMVRAALALRGASLVLYREKTLVEFKTERLGPGLVRYEEGGHTSWQIGSYEDHHCHLDVEACTEVVFGAEPVGCQGGRLNYTVWFLVAGDCGNPYRPRAYFSVTLNRPYADDGRPRREVIDPVFDLFRELEGRPGVSAEPAFLCALEERYRAASA
jgi:hypothetical protein